MPRHTLYAYVDGCDLDDVAPAIQARLMSFIASRRWLAGDVWAVNRRDGPETCSAPGELPEWNLGLNIELPAPGTEPRGWFTDVEAIALFLSELSKESGWEFILGLANNETGIAEDIFDISAAEPDLKLLRRVIGTEEDLLDAPHLRS